MKIICSYCRQPQPDKEPLDDERISHTICRECYDHYSPQWEGLSLDGYLDRFDAPVLVVAGDGRIVASNRQAGELLGKPETEITGLLGGEAMECVYARKPGGCGKTEHCETCSIRIAVMTTLETGEPFRMHPVELRRDDGPLKMTISTDTIGDLVRVVIEG